MQIFAVMGMKQDQRQAVVSLATKAFRESNTYQVDGGLFLATDGNHTTQEVAKKIGIGDDKNNFRGVVINAKFNWGFHDSGLWEWMEVKSGDNDK